MNKRERKAYELSLRLPTITKRQMDYAERHLDRYAFSYYRKTYCSECGSPVVDGKCVGCGIKFGDKVRNRRLDSFYYGIVTTCGGMQVIRHFLVVKTAAKDARPTYSFLECFQNWIDDDGYETVVAKQRAPFTYDTWLPLSEMKVRHCYSVYYSPFEIGDYLVYSRVRVTDRLRRNGFRGDFYGEKPLELFRMLLKDNFVETLVKTGRGHMLKHGTYRLKECAKELALCHRHRYEIEDVSIWLDMVLLLRRCGVDTLNPRNVCPEDLALAHAAALERDRRRREKEEQIREHERIAKDMELIAVCEKAYAKAKGRYFGIVLTGDGIVVTTLKSVRDIYDEGKAMHHCVFANEYYKKKDSLILSAKDVNGKRLETIEFDLSNGTVLQSRGVCNQPSEFHDAIVELVTTNAQMILRMKKARRTSRPAA